MFSMSSALMNSFKCVLLHSFLLCCISLPFAFSTRSILGNETDRLALLAFKSQITHDPLKVMSSWNDSRHFCDWEGVTCGRRHQRVTVLSLESKSLTGSISQHIGNLTFLKRLFLPNNSFHGEIPDALTHLFRLENLVLKNNSLVGKIPVNISRCSNLKSLFLSYNNLEGKIPIELGSLSKLVRLVLDFNNLSGGIPPSLGNLTSLEVLSISENSLGGSIPGTLAQLKSLKILELGNTNLSGTLPSSLYNLSTLEIISLDDNQLTGILPTQIGFSFPNLQMFLIGANQFFGGIPASLPNASRLQIIDIQQNQFVGNVPLNFGDLKDLQRLVLHSNHLGAGKSGDLDFFASLTNCTSLQLFSMGANQFGGMLPASIVNFSSQLYQMYLGDNQIFGNIPIGIGNLQSMSYFSAYSNFLTGSIPMDIGNLQNLEILDMRGNRLSGRIPSSIRNMSRLFVMELSNNFFEGDIASCLSNNVLQTLNLDHNNFTGTIPKQEIGLSSRLINFDASHNALVGSIPSEISNLRNLYSFDVSENKLSGEIPNSISSCTSLEYLNCQGNLLQGSIPHSLSDLRGLLILDLSRNNISGKIPKELEKLLALQSLNLSFNKLEGEVPMKGAFHNASVVSVVGNNKLCGGIPKLLLSKCDAKRSKKQGFPLVFKVTVGILVLLLLIIAFFVVICMRKKSKAKPHTESLPRGLKRVTYNDLHKATDGFSSENLIGMGSHGSVYKGTLHHGEGPIVVKVFNLMEPGASKSFTAECEALRAVRHRNLLKILTVCSSMDFNGNDFKALIFEFMPNGSLESWLHPNEQNDRGNLNLHQRLNIVIDVAYALDYLHNHCETPVIHCDLKPSNVLLNDDTTAHVGDFGLAKFKGATSSNKNQTDSISIRGTIGYIPPEYGMGAEVSIEGDAYSYGVMLLEMFTGRRPTDHMFKDGLDLHEYCKMALTKRGLEM